MKYALSEDTRFRKQVSLVQSNTNRLWEECPENPWQALERQQLHPDACQIAANLPGCLVFNTTVTRLDVDQLLLGNIYDVPDEFREIMLNSDDRILDLIAWLRPDERITASDDFRRCQLLVMLVARDVSQPYVARRLAVGYVNTRCCEGYTTRWETIVLC
uniref:Uncharacterized protein n=1 Tax=Gibberella zeae TaxID=5518 RepID=A0A4E9EJS5_GIBZA